MILLNRLEKFAAQKGYFSELQFGFSKQASKQALLFVNAGRVVATIN